MPADTFLLNKKIDKIVWRCPSNIAIVKYWGKKGIQIPCNASVSLTLSESYSEIELDFFNKKNDSPIELDYFFEGEKKVPFENRIRKYLSDHLNQFPVLNNYAIRINSHNSFPHSAGIASSASAFGAIALSLLDASFILKNQPRNDEFFKQSSQLARLGSGSACRSIYGGFVLWGKNKMMADSSNEFAIPITDIHQNFKQWHDAILIIDENPKKVSSSAGHSLMNKHVYAKSRFAQANERAAQIVKILSGGDYEEFIKIAESEALTLHAMMMTSGDYYLLMKPGTIIAIEKIMDFRRETKVPVCFTLDAGPNVHLLYPEDDKNTVASFINGELKGSVKKIIFDKMGNGPQKIK
jgi:diphosphomevalonate decarboxylase